MTARGRATTIVVASTLAVVGGFALGVLRQRHRASGSQDVTPSSASAPVAVTSAGAQPPNGASHTHNRGDFVGSSACTPCHAAESAAYAQSHHASALVPVAQSRAAAVNGAHFSTPLGGTTTFTTTLTQKDGAPTNKDSAFTVTTPNADAHPQSFPVVYTAGVSPLQQLIVVTERGKLQTLAVSWDTRPHSDGGERWFHVYGPRGIAPTDELYFTQPAQNFNHVCADCHSTFVERRYDVTADRFDTTWTELAVGCEACHGPGAAHVKAARAAQTGAGVSNVPSRALEDRRPSPPTLTVSLKPAAPWSPSPSGSPVPRPQDNVEIEVCAPCHSRREPLREGFVAGEPFLDAFEPELLRAGRYHSDGQLDGEDYEWGSFVQSKMYASGVRCSDCHEPHAAELRATSNALCVRCHEPARFDVPTHSHHTGDITPRCVDCHMPPKTFMQVDERRDHSIRIPRPDLSATLGTPNACNGCHTTKTAEWARDQLAKWYPDVARRPHFAAALAADRQGALGAPRALADLANDAAAPAIARATALERLGQFPSGRALQTLRASLTSANPLVVLGAALGASTLPLTERAPLLLPLLEDPRLAVRVAAAEALAELPVAQLDATTRAALERGFAEVEARFAVSASQPETHVARSAFEQARGHSDAAEAELRTALRLAPCLAEAHLNLADLARARHDEALAGHEIDAALACAPSNGFAHHARGLWLTRAGNKDEALSSLAKAVELMPEHTRFSYVLAVALAEQGKLERAVEVLRTALARHPNDQDALRALAEYLRKLDRKEQATEADAQLRALLEQ